MPDKKVKFTRWSLGFVFLLSFVLSNTWQIGENHLFFWASRFLIGAEISVFGLALLFFPYFMLKVCGSNKNDLAAIPQWKFRIIGLIAGIPISILGINYISVIAGRWLAECYSFFCLPSVP